MNNLAEELRERARFSRSMFETVNEQLFTDAASVIDQLTRERDEAYFRKAESEKWRDAFSDRAEAAEQQVDKMRKIAEVIASLNIVDSEPDNAIVLGERGMRDRITVGQVRSARAALADTETKL